jgi:hypothetical protein
MATKGDGTPLDRRSNNGAGTQKHPTPQHDQLDGAISTNVRDY